MTSRCPECGAPEAPPETTYYCGYTEGKTPCTRSVVYRLKALHTLMGQLLAVVEEADAVDPILKKRLESAIYAATQDAVD